MAIAAAVAMVRAAAVAAAVAMLEAEAVVLDGACVCARGGGTQVQVLERVYVWDAGVQVLEWVSDKWDEEGIRGLGAHAPSSELAGWRSGRWQEGEQGVGGGRRDTLGGWEHVLIGLGGRGGGASTDIAHRNGGSKKPGYAERRRVGVSRDGCGRFGRGRFGSARGGMGQKFDDARGIWWRGKSGGGCGTQKNTLTDRECI